MIYEYLLPDHTDAPHLRCSRIATWRGQRALDRVRDPIRWPYDVAKYGYVISVRSNIVNLARACRQFEDEILPLMYRQCTFEVAIGSTFQHVRSGIDKPIPLDASKIRNLELRFRGWDSALDKYRKEDLVKFFAGIQWGRNLKSATFVAHFTVVWKSEKEVMAFLCPAWEKLECPFRIEFAFMRFSEGWLWDQQEESKMVLLMRQFHGESFQNFN